jgi:outer membrane biosynthesis protein TonB
MRTAVAVLALAACHHAAPHSAAPAPAPALTADVVLETVRGGYMTGVQRCYTRYLKNAGGHGRVVVSFTVNAKGEATEGAASGVPARLGDCIVAEVARWRFPPPRGGEQSFALPLDLIAD